MRRRARYCSEVIRAKANAQDRAAGPGNAAPGVGGTAQDGGLSTAATVEDGGPDAKAVDGTYKP